MPGMKQAGCISNDRLRIHLSKFGYAPVARTPSLWKQATKKMLFSLVVNDFGVKHVGKENYDHLIQALRKLYTISIDWTGARYCGLTLAWDYTRRTCDIYILEYLPADLHKFQHPLPTCPQDSLYAWKTPAYGATFQWADNPDDSPILTAKSITLLQQIIGTLLYYAIAVEPTMIAALGSIAAQQSKATHKTYSEVLWLLKYAASHPGATIRYLVSDMILHVHSDAYYLSEPKARSRAGGHYFLSNRSPDPTRGPNTNPTLNGPIHTVSNIMSNVMSSAAEAKIVATFLNGQEAAPIRTKISKLGHPQPATPIRVYNSTT